MAKPKQLDEQTIKTIRNLYATGKQTQSAIARQFNLSQSTVCKIINYEIHKKSLGLGGEALVKVGFKHGN